MEIQIAIVEENVLAAMGLQQLLEDIIPMATIRHFPSFESLVINNPEQFVHFFVSSAIYFEHATYFQAQPHRSIVLVRGNGYPRLAGLLTLNVCQDVKSLVKDVLSLRGHGHEMPGHPGPSSHPNTAETSGLSTGSNAHSVETLTSRETEVAILLAHGYINKEVADRLNISLPTAITHRRNIMDKLHARSLADIIVYLVTRGIIGLDEL